MLNPYGVLEFNGSFDAPNPLKTDQLSPLECARVETLDIDLGHPLTKKSQRMKKVRPSS